jgi:hypothetical protein
MLTLKRVVAMVTHSSEISGSMIIEVLLFYYIAFE